MRYNNSWHAISTTLILIPSGFSPNRARATFPHLTRAFHSRTATSLLSYPFKRVLNSLLPFRRSPCPTIRQATANGATPSGRPPSLSSQVATISMVCEIRSPNHTAGTTLPKVNALHSGSSAPLPTVSSSHASLRGCKTSCL